MSAGNLSMVFYGRAVRLPRGGRRRFWALLAVFFDRDLRGHKWMSLRATRTR
jgi:hypothetical protein